ncbi:hypothetical protein L9F63_007581, partial [Diploptera punctata]
DFLYCISMRSSMILENSLNIVFSKAIPLRASDSREELGFVLGVDHRLSSFLLVGVCTPGVVLRSPNIPRRTMASPILIIAVITDQESQSIVALPRSSMMLSGMETKNSTNVFDVAPLLFGWLDFTVFGLVLLATAAVGVYYGFFNKQKTKVEYLLGGKSMSTIPVALSLVACHISGVTVMGVPSEVFTYGSTYILVCFSCILVAVIMNYVYLPVFFELQLTSTYEYLEMRFSRSVRVMASLLYTIAMLLYVPIVVYVPALAFSQ